MKIRTCSVCDRKEGDVAGRFDGRPGDPLGPVKRCESCGKWACPDCLHELGSIAVHADEMLSPDGHEFDKIALKQLLADQEVCDWIDEMTDAAFLPVKRNAKKTSG